MSQAPGYTVSPELLAREDFRQACAQRDFGTVFKLMQKWDGVSQDRICSPVEGLNQTRVSKIMRGQDRIASMDIVERIADSLHIPGGYLGLAPRLWEALTKPVQAATLVKPAPVEVLAEAVGSARQALRPLDEIARPITLRATSNLLRMRSLPLLPP